MFLTCISFQVTIYPLFKHSIQIEISQLKYSNRGSSITSHQFTVIFQNTSEMLASHHTFFRLDYVLNTLFGLMPKVRLI